MFIKQHLHSDYCAVYATAMCLSLAGTPTSRKEAIKLFGVKVGSWTGASHGDIRRAVIAARPDVNRRWRHIRRPASQGILRLLANAAGRGEPVLVTAYCRHRKLDISCGHAFILTCSQTSKLTVLDPLGNRPQGAQSHNAEIGAIDESSQILRIFGTQWDIELDQPISLLSIPILGQGDALFRASRP